MTDAHAYKPATDTDLSALAHTMNQTAEQTQPACTA